MAPNSIYELKEKDLKEMKKQLEASLKQIEAEISAFQKAIRTATLNKFGCESTIDKIREVLRA